MGHCCPTASLLKDIGLRHYALPLDGCRATLAVWQHIVSDHLRALRDPANVCHADSGRPYHALYSPTTFSKSDLWEHGHDASTWERRCDRLHELLQSEVSKLGVHIAFEAAPSACQHFSMRFQEVVFDACALIDTWDELLGSASFRLVAIVFCERGSESGRLSSVCVDPPAMDRAYRGEWVTLSPLQCDENDDCAPFAIVTPRPRVTVIRYNVPHDERNREGNALPEDQAALLPADARRIVCMLRGLFPEYFLGKVHIG